MKLTSSIRIKNRYNIDEVIGQRCKITFIDLDSEQEETHEIEGETITEYIYNAYQVEMMFNEENINAHYAEYINSAKQNEYDLLANEIRAKRNQLLNETDKDMALDRLDLDTSSAIKFLASLKNIFNNSMAQYRQELRDITKQPNFPYDVVFPTKPKE